MQWSVEFNERMHSLFFLRLRLLVIGILEKFLFMTLLWYSLWSFARLLNLSLTFCPWWAIWVIGLFVLQWLLVCFLPLYSVFSGSLFFRGFWFVFSPLFRFLSVLYIWWGDGRVLFMCVWWHWAARKEEQSVAQKSKLMTLISEKRGAKHSIAKEAAADERLMRAERMTKRIDETFPSRWVPCFAGHPLPCTLLLWAFNCHTR